MNTCIYCEWRYHKNTEHKHNSNQIIILLRILENKLNESKFALQEKLKDDKNYLFWGNKKYESGTIVNQRRNIKYYENRILQVLIQWEDV